MPADVHHTFCVETILRLSNKQIFLKDTAWKRNVALFFLGCVLVAGAFGAMTASTGILFVQALPALLAILSLLALKPKTST